MKLSDDFLFTAGFSVFAAFVMWLFLYTQRPYIPDHQWYVHPENPCINLGIHFPPAIHEIDMKCVVREHILTFPSPR